MLHVYIYMPLDINEKLSMCQYAREKAITKGMVHKHVPISESQTREIANYMDAQLHMSVNN